MMYYRRKIIIALFEVFNGELTAKKFQKLLFLLTRGQEVKSFDFIPYKYGCFSFQANQDILTLSKYGYFKIEEGENGRYIQLKENLNLLDSISINDKILIQKTKEEFGNLSQMELIKYTYINYPFYSINSSIAEDILTKEELKNIQQQKRHFDTKELFTIGYEGISLEKYINSLILKDVKILCDVRKNALSRKYGFSKEQLQKACYGVGIEYIHIPQLGIESDKRQELKTKDDYQILFKSYQETTLVQNKNYLLSLKEIIDKYKRVALTCFEKDPLMCHRSYIAKELMKLDNIDFKTTNLINNG